MTKDLSTCCQAPIKATHGCDDDFLHGGKKCTCEIVTSWYICEKCKQACDPLVDRSKIGIGKVQLDLSPDKPETIQNCTKELARYFQACEAVNLAFAQKYFTDEDGDVCEYDCVGDRPDEAMNIADYWYSMDNRITALEYDIPEKTLFAWYNESVEKYVPCTSACEKRKRAKFMPNLKNSHWMMEESKPLKL